MNNPKSRQAWIYEKLINEPTLNYVETFAMYSENFAFSRRTFDKDWKKATARFKEYQERINEEKLKEAIKIEKKAVKRDILTKIESMELLTKFAKDKKLKVYERINALKELANYEGWHSPKKTENLHRMGAESEGITIGIVNDTGNITDYA